MRGFFLGGIFFYFFGGIFKNSFWRIFCELFEFG